MTCDAPIARHDNLEVKTIGSRYCDSPDCIRAEAIAHGKDVQAITAWRARCKATRLQEYATDHPDTEHCESCKRSVLRSQWDPTYGVCDECSDWFAEVADSPGAYDEIKRERDAWVAAGCPTRPR
jgi:hypothetical protein